jgi:hypothetical protein
LGVLHIKVLGQRDKSNYVTTVRLQEEKSHFPEAALVKHGRHHRYGTFNLRASRTRCCIIPIAAANTPASSSSG